MAHKPQTLHYNFWNQSSSSSTGYFQNNSLLSSNPNDQKLAPSDYFFSFLPLLQDLNPNQKAALRPKCPSTQKFTKTEKTEIDTKRKNKEIIKQDSCTTGKEKYIKCKVDKLIVLDDIESSISSHLKEYLQSEVESMVSLLRMNNALLDKIKMGKIDSFVLSCILENKKDFAKEYINGDDRKLKEVLCFLIKNDPLKFKSILNSIYSKYLNDDDEAVKKQKLKEKTEVNSLINGLVNNKISFEDVKKKIESEYCSVFNEFKSDLSLGELNQVIFPTLTVSEQKEQLKKMEMVIVNEIQSLEGQLKKLLNTYCDKFAKNIRIDLDRCITADMSVIGGCYDFKTQSIMDLGNTARTNLNSLAMKQKREANSVEVEFDLFNGTIDIKSGNPASNSSLSSSSNVSTIHSSALASSSSGMDAAMAA